MTTDSSSASELHREHIARCEAEIASGAPAPDADRRTVHVRCGSDIAQGLRRAGYVGTFLEFADPVCHGPVPALDDASALEMRAAFISTAYALPLAECLARMQRESAALQAARDYERIVLWFEHDSYDQLILARILATLFEHGDNANAVVELICIGTYPGMHPFHGLGELSHVALRGLWAARRVVTPDDYALGTAVWGALRQPDPRALAAIAQGGTPAVPWMAGAVGRHLMELPWRHDGLSLTQRQLLKAVRAGALRCGALFRALIAADPLPFLGDAMVWWEIRELAAAGAVRLQPNDEPWSQRGVTMTAQGNALLDGHADWIEVGGRERWVGGVPCGAVHPAWRWDSQRAQPVCV